MDRRGKMTRSDRQMPDAEARDFLRAHAVAHVGTTDEAGWPYVVPLMYVYETGTFSICTPARAVDIFAAMSAKALAFV